MPEEPTAWISPDSRRPFWDRIVVRLPFLVDLGAAAGLRLPSDSPLRRRGVKQALRAAWDGINRGDVEPARLFYERDAEVFLFGAEGLGLDERYSGQRGWVDFIGDIFENFAEPRFTVRRVRDGGDRLVVELELTARGKGSGVQLVKANSTVYYLSPRGKIARQDVFWQGDSWNVALEAAGLPE